MCVHCFNCIYILMSFCTVVLLVNMCVCHLYNKPTYLRLLAVVETLISRPMPNISRCYLSAVLALIECSKERRVNASLECLSHV